MDNSLLEFYSDELSYLSQLFSEFAAAHPGIARELRINSHNSEDPHVSRMIQSFALINAKTKQLLDDNFSELSNTLLELLYPHYLAPFPSCSIFYFHPEKDLTTLKTLSAGRCIEVHSQQSNCVYYFTTVYDIDLLPIQINEVNLNTYFKDAPNLFEKNKGFSALNIKLETTESSLNFNLLTFKKLRFYIKAQKISASKLYDLLFCHGLVLHCYADNKKIFEAPCNTCIKNVGFDPQEGILNFSEQSSIGYRLLTEFFAFPEKFLFFDIYFTDKMLEALQYNKIDIFIVFSKREEMLETYINKSYLSLYCSPVVNLFKKTAEPIAINYTRTKYQVIADLDAAKKTEVYNIIKATILDNENNDYECKPFFSIGHYYNQQTQKYFWQMHRKNSDFNNEQKIYVSIVDLSLQEDSQINKVLAIEAFCTNGCAPALLTTNGVETYIQFQESGTPVEYINSLTGFTEKRQWSQEKDVYWRLISHLNLNHISLYDNFRNCEVLREVLHLYDYIDDEDSLQLINSIKDIQHEQILLRDPSGILNTFIQGLKIKLIIMEDATIHHSLFLFGSILDYFFSLNCALNSFTQLDICNEQYKVIHKWPARNGAKLII